MWPPSVVVCCWMYTTARGSSGHKSHTFCSSLFVVCGLKRTLLLLFVCGGCGLSFFVTPSLAVFCVASAFNQNVSTWNTGAVTSMERSKCALSHFLSVATAPSVVVCCWIYIRQLEFYLITKFSHVLLFCFVYWNGPFYCLWWVGLSFFYCTSSCSVSYRICVQSERVRMEYGCGNKYGR